MTIQRRFCGLWRRLAAAPPEIEILAAALAFAASSFAFLKLVDEMREGETQAVDRVILMALRAPGDLSDPIGPVWLETVCRDLTSLGGPAVLALVTALAIGRLCMDGRRASALSVAVAVAGGAAATAMLKLGFARPRPEVVSHLVDEASFSFPSGHATMATVVYLTLGVLLAGEQARPRIKLYVVGAALAVSVIVGLTRIYLGVHWPTDVLAGWCFGAAWALGCRIAAGVWRSHGAP
jgi:undecaprenyl-diphosphatase